MGQLRAARISFLNTKYKNALSATTVRFCTLFKDHVFFIITCVSSSGGTSSFLEKSLCDVPLLSSLESYSNTNTSFNSSWVSFSISNLVENDNLHPLKAQLIIPQ
jgi:hypothetical protein